MWKLQTLSENGIWQSEEEHKRDCQICRGGPDGWVGAHGQTCRWIDEQGNIKPLHAPLFEGIAGVLNESPSESPS